MATSAELFDRAMRCHQNGDLAQAELLYRQLIAAAPAHADALHFLGILAHQTGRPQVAVTLIGQAIAQNPNATDFHFNLGIVHKDQGQWAQAVHCFRQVLRLNPGHAAAPVNLGLALVGQGQLAEAVTFIEQALRLNPNHAELHNNLGIALAKQGKFAAAGACYRQALRLNPRDADAHNNLGLALKHQGQLDQAIATFRQALALDPNQESAHNNLGNTLYGMDRIAEAEECFRQLLRIRPAQAEALNSLGNVLKDQGRLDEALTSYQAARKLEPHNQRRHSNFLFCLLFHPRYDAGALFDEHCRWEEQHAHAVAPVAPAFDNDASRERRLRIGYISPCFRDHVIGRNIWPLLRNHDHQQFHITLYANASQVDALTEQMQKCADHWCNIAGWSDEQVAAKIRQDQIDILVALNLHLGENRLMVFARKPAPVQVTFAGYPGSTGLKTIAYRLTDPYLDPPNAQDCWYSEASHRLPNSFWCYDPPSKEPAVAPLPALVKGYVTFGCLNNFCKINDDVLELWAAVLRAVKNARLLVLTQEGSHRKRLCEFLAQRGIAAERIAFCSRRPTPKYLALYHQIDIGLDTFPYNGHTTSLDSFWMGVPVITLIGNTVVGRAGLSQLTNLGLQELAATTAADFVRLAADLASDLPKLQELRAGLRERMRLSPLMDSEGFTRGIEQAYRNMWLTWCDQQQRSHGSPENADAHNDRGAILFGQGQLAEAAECFRHALHLNPNHAEAQFNLANAINNLGYSLAERGKAAEALECFRQALRMNPSHADAHANLGGIFCGQRQLTAAAECCRQALRINADHTTARFNLALVQLIQGNLESGWQDFELRLAMPGVVPRAFSQPCWDGSLLNGKTILVYAERGLGDTFHFMRYLPFVQQRGGRVLFECQPSVFRLLTGIAGVDQLVAAGTPLPHFDVQTPLFSLPRLFGTTLATIPADVPYLQADPRLVAHWRNEIKRTMNRNQPAGDILQANEHLKVGIVWQGSLFEKNDSRSFSLAHFEPLARMKGIKLLSLQVGRATEQLKAVSFPVIDLGSRFDPHSLADLAAALVNMDLVVTVDTSVPHLAGALGVPVWTVLSFASDWRWLLDCSDSPWYPTMRLFRQKQLGNWTEVFERLAVQLNDIKKE